jgi:transposase InsO family protein
MQRTHRRGPSTTWRSFLRQHGSEIWACDFFCVRTITFRTLYVFFVIDHASRQVLHVHVTPNPTASWAAQQMVECCAWDRRPPRFLVYDRDSCYGATFHRRVRNIGIAQVRTPFRSPRANAIAERWVRSIRTECLDHVRVAVPSSARLKVDLEYMLLPMCRHLFSWDIGWRDAVTAKPLAVGSRRRANGLAKHTCK